MIKNVLAALLLFLASCGPGCLDGHPEGPPCDQWKDCRSCTETALCGWCDGRCVFDGDPTEPGWTPESSTCEGEVLRLSRQCSPRD